VVDVNPASKLVPVGLSVMRVGVYRDGVGLGKEVRRRSRCVVCTASRTGVGAI
jgi:hypothetical protein